ncbi:NS73 [Marbled eel reovirus]|nr:NS73 [Marbled eel reovirus]
MSAAKFTLGSLSNGSSPARGIPNTITPTQPTPTFAPASHEEFPPLLPHLNCAPIIQPLELNVAGVSMSGIPPPLVNSMRPFATHLVDLITTMYPEKSYPRFADACSAMVGALAALDVTETTDLTEAEVRIQRYVMEARTKEMPVLEGHQDEATPFLDDDLVESDAIPDLEEVDGAVELETPPDHPVLNSEPPTVHFEPLITDDWGENVERVMPLDSLVSESVSAPIQQKPTERSRSPPRRNRDHIANDQDYNLSRLAYARGNPELSPMFGRSKEAHLEEQFFASFPRAVNGKWIQARYIMTVIAAEDEDLSACTFHTLRRIKDRDERYAMTASDGTIVAKLRVIRVPRTRGEHIIQSLNACEILAITGPGAAALVRANLTDGVFSKQYRRVVMGIDPIFIPFDTPALHLFSILTDHKLSYARGVAAMSLRVAMSSIENPLYHAHRAWFKSVAPTTIAAMSDDVEDRRVVTAAVLYADVHTPRTSAQAASENSQLRSLTDSLTERMHQLEAERDALVTANASLHADRCDDAGATTHPSLANYLSHHVCVNTHEESFLRQHLDADSADTVQAARSASRDQARTGCTADLNKQLDVLNSEVATMRDDRDEALSKVDVLEQQLKSCHFELEQAHIVASSTASAHADILNQRDRAIADLHAQIDQLETRLTSIRAAQSSTRERTPRAPAAIGFELPEPTSLPTQLTPAIPSPDPSTLFC